jgi:hypothetical protein
MRRLFRVLNIRLGLSLFNKRLDELVEAIGLQRDCAV